MSDKVIYDNSLKNEKLKLNYVIGDAEKLEIRQNGFCVWMKSNAKSMISGSHLPNGGDYKLAQFHVNF